MDLYEWKIWWLILLISGVMRCPVGTMWWPPPVSNSFRDTLWYIPDWTHEKEMEGISIQCSLILLKSPDRYQSTAQSLLLILL